MSLYDCPYCHVTEGRVISRQPRVVRCNTCGLYRLSPRMGVEDERQHLADCEARLDLGNYPVKLDGICDPEVTMLATTFPRIRDGARVLDVGCAEGSFTYALKKAGARPIGIEPLGRLADYARGFGIDIRKGAFEDLPPGLCDAPFDLICFREVIYYLNDMKAALQKTRALLGPGGGLYVKAHVASSLYYLRDKNRTTRYGLSVQGMPTKDSLEFLLRAEGFHILESNPLPYHVAHVLGFSASSVSGRILNRATRKLFDLMKMYDRISILARKA